MVSLHRLWPPSFLYAIQSIDTGARAISSKAKSDYAAPPLENDTLCSLLTWMQVWLLLRQLCAIILSLAPCLTANSEIAPKDGSPRRGYKPWADLFKPGFYQQHLETCFSSTEQRRFVSFALFYFSDEKIYSLSPSVNLIPRILDSVPNGVSKPVTKTKTK